MGSLIKHLSSINFRDLGRRFALPMRNLLLTVGLRREAMLHCEDGKFRVGRVIAETHKHLLIRVFWDWGPWGAMWFTWWLTKDDPRIAKASWWRIGSTPAPHFRGASIIAAP